MNDLITQIAGSLGLAPASLAILLMTIGISCQVISRLIPDDSTGLLKQFQRVVRFIGADLSNRVTSGVTMREMAKAAIETNPELKAKLEVPDDSQGTLELTEDQRIRRFPPAPSNLVPVILALALFVPILSGCATLGVGVQRACQNRDAALALVIALGNDKTSDYAIRVYRYVNAICPVVIDDINKGKIPGVTPVPIGLLPARSSIRLG